MRFSLGRTALLVACAALASWPVVAQTVKVGAILTLSGTQAGLGETIQKGMNLYVKEHPDALPPGVKVEVIYRDDTGVNADLAKRLAQELIVRDQVQMLTGITWTPNAMAVAAFTADAKIPTIMSGNGAPASTRSSPYVVKTSFTVWQSCYPIGQWAAAHGIKDAYTAVADYAGGTDAENAFTKGFTEGGGKIDGSVRIPLNTVDYLPYVQRIKDAKPTARRPCSGIRKLQTRAWRKRRYSLAISIAREATTSRRTKAWRGTGMASLPSRAIRRPSRSFGSSAKSSPRQDRDRCGEDAIRSHLYPPPA